MGLNQLPEILKKARIVPELSGLLRGNDELWLVGGALRDLLLGRPGADFDFAGPFDPTPLAREFASRIGGHWFLLDAERRQSRVVIRREEGEVTCDFAPFRAPGLEADLRLRDFTVNALAVRLLPDGSLGPLFDPLGGQADLSGRWLRACSLCVFLDDHLRVLKGVRHALTLGFALEAETASLMRQAAPLIPRIAPERVRAEVAAIFAADTVARGIGLLDGLGLLPVLFGPAGEGGSVGERDRLADRMEEVLATVGQEHPDLLAEEFEAGLSRAALLRLAAFLRGWRPLSPERLCEGLRLGRRAAAVLRHLLQLPAEKGREAEGLPDLPRARALWAESLGGSIPDSLLFVAMLQEDHVAAVHRFLPLLEEYLRHLKEGRLPDLVDGRWLREQLGVAEGPEVGRLLALLRREELAGRVGTPEEARNFLLERKKSR